VQHLKWGNPDFWAFMACRAMVGIGEASYSTIAPTIISDMFVKDMRSKMLALFYFAIPVGRCVRSQHQLKGLSHEIL
jgi:MFS family permease